MSAIISNGNGNGPETAANGGHIPSTQTAALVRQLGGQVEFDENYPVPEPGHNEVLAKVLYTGVCQSDLHTKQGTAAGPDGHPITNIKLPHVGGHEGVGRIVALGPGCKDDLRIGQIVGIRFGSRVCRRCEYCLAGKEQHCLRSTNHLHHEDGSFQQFVALDGDYLTILPNDVPLHLIGPVLCAGLTAYKAVMNCDLKLGDWMVVIGAGGGLGHLAVQYAKARGARVIAIDSGDEKRNYCMSLGATHFLDFKTTPSVPAAVYQLTNGGAHGVVCTAGSGKAYALAAELLRLNGTLACVGIPPGGPVLEVAISTIVIKGLRIVGSLVGSLKETLEAVELTRLGIVTPNVQVRPFKDLPRVYEELQRDAVAGRIVLKVAEDE